MKLIVKDMKQKTSINETLDLSKYVKESIDLISINDCRVKGFINKDFNTLTFLLNIKANIVQKCNITLLPVSYDLSFDTEIIYSDDLEIMDYYLPEYIILEELVYAEIILEKEPAVYHKDANLDEFTNKDKGHHAFKVLKEMVKEEE